MTILMIEGFDLHSNRQVGGLDAGGDQDMSTYWWGGTIVVPTFVAGYETGRALRNDGNVSILSSRNKYPSQTGQMRWGFIARGDNPVTQTTRFVSVGNYNLDAIFVSLNQDGDLQLRQAAGVGNPSIALSGTAPGILVSAWKAFEFLVTAAGRVELWVSGVKILEGQGTPVANINSKTMGTSAFSNAMRTSMDHMWFTDGPRLDPTKKVQAVSISAAADRYEGSNGFHGTLSMEGERYVTDWDRAVISSLNVDNGNVTNILNFVYPVDPSTGAAWTDNATDLIEGWGVCFHPFIDPTTIGDRVRLAGLCFSYLDYNDGMPIVRAFKPSGMTQFSGPWERSDTTKSYQAHVNYLPRQYEPDMDLADYLLIGDYGCMIFDSPFTEGSGGGSGPELLKVGLTFAEEFRADNRDWVRVTGSGNSFESMFESGYSVLGEGNKKFQNNFVTVNYENVPTGACYIQGLWDYAETGETGRWSMRQILENKGGDYKHGFRRLKIRGHGKAMQLRVTNKGDAPFVVNGWAMFITSNTGV